MRTVRPVARITTFIERDAMRCKALRSLFLFKEIFDSVFAVSFVVCRILAQWIVKLKDAFSGITQLACPNLQIPGIFVLLHGVKRHFENNDDGYTRITKGAGRMVTRR